MASSYPPIRRARVSAPIPNNYKIKQISYLGKTVQSEIISPYGTAYNPPVNSLCITLPILCDEGNLASIAYDPKTQFPDLKEGEYQIGNPLVGSSIKFLADGSIEIVAKGSGIVRLNGTEFQINAETTNTGTLNIIGAVFATLDVSALTASTLITFTALIGKYNSHLHKANLENQDTDGPNNQLP